MVKRTGESDDRLCSGDGYGYGRGMSDGMGDGHGDGYENAEGGGNGQGCYLGRGCSCRGAKGGGRAYDHEFWMPITSDDARRTARIFRCAGCVGGFECPIHGRRL